MGPRYFVVPLVFSLVFASPKTGGQKYSPDLSPAPDVSVRISRWCDGLGFFYNYYVASWLPLLSGIVIFASLITSGPQKKRVFPSRFVTTIDAVLSGLSAVLMCGPIVRSSLHETMLDYSVLRYLHGFRKGRHSREYASMMEIELKTLLRAGYLEETDLTFDLPAFTESVFRAHPDELIRGLFEISPSFGSVVLGPTVIYMIGLLEVFIYAWDEGKDESSVTTSAFLVWCSGIGIMIMISRYLATDYNPRPAEGVGPLADIPDTVRSRPFSWPARANQATGYGISRWWEGSISKMKKLQCTAAWEDPYFRKQLITMNDSRNMFSVVALLLTTMPSALAVFIESTIHGLGEANLSRVIISYACVQFCLIFYFELKVSWSNQIDNRVILWKRDRINDVFHGPLKAALFVFSAWVRRRESEILVAAHFVLLMSVGICSKGPTIYRDSMVLAPYSTITLASDTAQARHANRQRLIAVFTTFGFLGFLGLLGWWQQRKLRLTVFEILDLELPDQKRFNRITPIHRTVNHMLFSYMANPVTMTMSHVHRRAYITYHHLMNKLVRPRLKSGFRRLEWCCSCGENLYGDFDNIVPEAVDKLAAILAKEETSTHTTPNASSESRSQQTLPPYHESRIHSSGILRHSPRTPLQSLPGLERENLALATSERSTSSNTVSVFLEVCVNTGRWERRLGEINISQARSDDQLFQAIKQKYLELGRSMRNYFFEPTDIRYVRFSVENRADVGILSRPEETALPSREEVEAKNYEYTPCPLTDLPPMPSNILLHFLNSPNSSRHINKTWMQRLPKKLSQSIFATNSPVIFGWGIHIVEGPDVKKITRILLLEISVAFGVTGLWWGLTKDTQGATGLGSLLMGAIAIWRGYCISLKLERW